MRMMHGVVAALFAATTARGAVVVEAVQYEHGGVAMEGFVAYDDAATGKRPGVLVVHDWMGVGPFSKEKAAALAALGYVAFAADIYGKAVRPKSADEARAAAGKTRADPAVLRARARAALDALAKHPRVDGAKLAAIGFCFGGTTALELARAGAPLAATVSFHGGLTTTKPATKVAGKVLVLHGADDPHVPDADVAAFEAEMRAAGADWQVVKYGGAVHAFMVPGAGADKSKGAAYDARVAARAWTAMRALLDEALAR
jgi:dienelactone hydrolase